LNETVKPIVSVIITTYNRSNFLKKSTKSVLEQTYKKLELIIVDDCSTDETEQVVYNIKDKRVKYIRHNENMGVHQSRNDGILNSNGKFIAFLDDDDHWLPKKLEKQVDLFMKKNSNLGLIYTGYYNALNGRIVAKVSPRRRGYLRDILINQNVVSTSTVLVRAECFKKVGLFEYIPFMEDWDMWIRISQYYEFDFVPDPLCIYNIHGNQATSNAKYRIIGQEIMLSKYNELWQQNYPNKLSNFLNSLGRLYYFTEFKQQSKRYFIQSIRNKFLQKSLFADLLLSKFLIRHFPMIFKINNASKNMIRILFDYYRFKLNKFLNRSK